MAKVNFRINVFQPEKEIEAGDFVIINDGVYIAAVSDKLVNGNLILVNLENGYHKFFDVPKGITESELVQLIKSRSTVSIKNVKLIKSENVEITITITD